MHFAKFVYSQAVLNTVRSFVRTSVPGESAKPQSSRRKAEGWVILEDVAQLPVKIVL